MIAESSPFPWFSTARRRTRRLIVVAYWIVALCVFGIVQWKEVLRPGHLDGLGLLFPLQAIIFLPAILGGVRAGGMVKPFRGVHWAPSQQHDETQTLFGPRRPVVNSMTAADLELDERDLRERDRMHFYAYTIARWLILLFLALQVGAVFLSPDWLLRAGDAAFFLLALVIWSLPQSMILWTEPDMEQPQ